MTDTSPLTETELGILRGFIDTYGSRSTDNSQADYGPVDEGRYSFKAGGTNIFIYEALGSLSVSRYDYNREDFSRRVHKDNAEVRRHIAEREAVEKQNRMVDGGLGRTFV